MNPQTPKPEPSCPCCHALDTRCCNERIDHKHDEFTHQCLSCGCLWDQAKVTPATEPAAAALTIPPELQPETANLVIRFASAMANKFYKAQVKYGYDKAEWRRDDWMQQCQAHLLEHLAKGDPRDVANYCAFMWHHGWSTVSAVEPPAAGEAGPAIIPGTYEIAVETIDAGKCSVCGNPACMQMRADFFGKSDQWIGRCSEHGARLTANPPAVQPLPAGGVDEEAERRLFEATLPASMMNPFLRERSPLNRYKDRTVQGKWESWLARGRLSRGEGREVK